MDEELKKYLETEVDFIGGLKRIAETNNKKIVFSTSFGMEDQVISHVIFKNQFNNIEVFTLDTGRLFPETYSVWNKTLKQYNEKINSYNPNTSDVENFVDRNGINPFYDSVSLRKECCAIRKVAPLNRALKNADIWITGLRAEQSENRNSLQKVAWDEKLQLYKYNPLLDWTTAQVKEFINTNAVPYNTLHDNGFISIGCAPCTRAIKEGEDFRAGRWWWEDKSKKECGLHQ